MKRLVWLIYVIWILFVGVVSFLLIEALSVPQEFTFFNDYLLHGGMYYISDNDQDEGILYSVSLEGEVHQLFLTREHENLAHHNIIHLDYREGGNPGPAALLSFNTTERGVPIVVYQVLQFDDNLYPILLSGPIRIDSGLKVSGFSIDAEDLYITALSEDGQEVFGYRADATELKDYYDIEKPKDASQQGEEETAFIEPELIVNMRADADRYYAQARYAESELYLRTDADDPPKVFTVPEDVKKISLSRQMTFGQKARLAGISLVGIFAFMLFGSLFIAAIRFLCSDHNRLIYEIFVFESLMLVLMVIFILFVSFQRSLFIVEGVGDTAKNTLSSIFIDLDTFYEGELDTNDFYNQQIYHTLQKAMSMRLSMNSGTGAQEIALVNAETGEVIISASGRNNQTITDLYGEQFMDKIVEARTRGGFSTAIIPMQRVNYSLYMLPLNPWHLENHVMILVDNHLGSVNLFSSMREMFIAALGTFLIGSVLGCIFLFAQQHDLRELAEALKKQAMGRTDIKKPKLRGVECKSMWNSVSEFQKNILALNRTKMLTFEAYFRFAPKNIEQILQKDSILDVYRGDIREMEGTMALFVNPGIRSGSSADLEVQNRYFSFLEKSMEAQNGILISASNDLSLIKVLFMQECDHTVSFGRDLLTSIATGEEIMLGFSVFLHYVPLTYGIAGTDKQSFVFTSAPEADLLERYSSWLASLNLGLVISETVMNREESIGMLRHIGFIKDGERKLRLYEVLDACTAKIRLAKIDTMGEFEEALRLFYSKDYYYARNVFMNVLKKLPEDGLSRWYLFECERYLNSDPEPEYEGEFLMR